MSVELPHCLWHMFFHLFIFDRIFFTPPKKIFRGDKIARVTHRTLSFAMNEWMKWASYLVLLLNWIIGAEDAPTNYDDVDDFYTFSLSFFRQKMLLAECALHFKWLWGRNCRLSDMYVCVSIVCTWACACVDISKKEAPFPYQTRNIYYSKSEREIFIFL